MAWQRTIPFGYQMRQGRIERNPADADTVRDIFTRYLQGESLQHIAMAMAAQGIRYHEHTAEWNKNMVKRVLENSRYLGDEQYPRVISDEDFNAAQTLRACKNTYTPCKVSDEIRTRAVCGQCGAKIVRVAKRRKTTLWKCESPDCGYTAHISDERLVAAVDALLDELAHTPEALAPRIPREAKPSGGAQRVANELTNALNRGAESVEYIRSLVFACAAEKYGELPDSSLQYKVDKLRERIEAGDTDKTLIKELLETAVRSIRITDVDNIALELINGQIIVKEAAEE